MDKKKSELFGKLIIKDKDFGERVKGRNTIKGRILYKLKDNMIENLIKSVSAFRTEINSDDNWINVGYVRKSPGIESMETRERLLEAMILKLSNRCPCHYVFASTSSTSSSSILERDFLTDKNTNSNNNIKAPSLFYGNGDTEAMIDFTGHTQSKRFGFI